LGSGGALNHRVFSHFLTNNQFVRDIYDRPNLLRSFARASTLARARARKEGKEWVLDERPAE
jgi:hypothetical protein